MRLLHHSANASTTKAELDVTPSRHRSRPTALGSTDQLLEMAEQQVVQAIHLVHQGQEREKGFRVFPRSHRLQEGVDGPGETRPLLKAFSDFLESEDLTEDSAREKTKTLVDHARSQSKKGKPMGLEELSGLIDEERARVFYDHIRNKD